LWLVVAYRSGANNAKSVGSERVEGGTDFGRLGPNGMLFSGRINRKRAGLCFAFNLTFAGALCNCALNTLIDKPRT